MRRIAAVFLPFLRIELARASLGDNPGPLALVIARPARPGGAVKDERSLLGNTRLDEVCPEARSLGLHAGQTIASARARCGALRVRVVQLDAVRGALSGLAEALLAYGATTSFDLENNVVWIDVTGCAHLHRSDKDVTGELNLVARIQACIEKIGHACRVAIADGPRVAAAVARFGPRDTRAGIVPAGESQRALRELPLTALPLPEDAIHWLSRLGMRTVGDLQQLPRRALSTRLGGGAATVMGLLDGEDATPLTPYIPPVVPEETATLEYGIDATEALLFVVKGLSDRIAARLAPRAMAVTHLELVLGLDRPLAPREPRASIDLPLASPLADAAAILSVLRSRIDAFTIEAPILSVTLRALRMAPRTATPLHLFLPEAKAARVLPRLVAELEAELGPGRVGILTLTHRWLAHERSRLVPIDAPHLAIPCSLPNPNSPQGARLSGAPEPTRLLTAGIPLPPARSVQIHVRQASVEWWTPGIVVLRDYATAWIDSLEAMAWIELDRAHNQAWICGWMD